MGREPFCFIFRPQFFAASSAAFFALIAFAKLPAADIFARAMPELEPPDTHYVSFAQGWLELGDVAAARADLERVSVAAREHPEVLAVRWGILAEERRWAEALAVAAELIKVAPEVPAGWINQAFALHELKGTAEARLQLLTVVKKFPRVSIIPYNLACYACQLGDLHESIAWLAKASAIAGKNEIKQMALADRDLEPLWPAIIKL